jgi:hypothetical protein
MATAYEFNSEVVVSTLERVVKILENYNIQYRFLGSVAVAAINGKLHRDLGDLDLIIDVSGKDTFSRELKNLGYKKAGGMFSFARKYLCLEQVTSPRLLSVGFFYGTWQTDGSFFIGNKNVGLSIESYAIIGTKYALHGVEFIGIPKSAVATGVNSSKTNPKRKKELIILKENRIEPFPNTYIHVKFFGSNADWIYHLSMKILNIIGAIRVKFGFAFDPWR